MRRIATILGLALLLTLPAAALARGGDAAKAPTADASLAQAAGVTIIDFAFSPSYVAVPAGSTVSWFNGGGAPHTVTSNTGAYSYFCEIHPGMVGAVEVY